MGEYLKQLNNIKISNLKSMKKIEKKYSKKRLKNLVEIESNLISILQNNSFSLILYKNRYYLSIKHLKL